MTKSIVSRWKLLRTLGTLVAAVTAIAATIWALTPNYSAVRLGHADAGYLTSTDCRKCHESNYASWHATFHRTMTRDADAETVLGDFEHENTISYQGIRAEMVREGGDYWMKLVGADGKKQQFKIERTVGSRRMQQYLTTSGDRWMRLPIAYDLVQRRWMHLNGSFFHADGAPYTQHVTEWNSNCVFCHNVKAQPGFDWEKKSWQTEVTELGIACGACHGPAGDHAQRALSPLTRTRWHLRDQSAAQIAVTNPAKLDSDRSAMICGHCHGQRIPEPPERIRAILSAGDPFNAGDDLAKFYQPVQRESKIGNFSFATRFWADGSPRLTAFEYQGMTRSKCFQAGTPGQRITCTSCHEMHGGDPRGQLTEQKKTNAACTQCHQKFTAPVQLAEHTKHSSDSTGSLCYNCHMPQVVFGIMSAHRTHEITNPRPQETVRFQKPNACNQCHLDWSVNRAIAERQRLWPEVNSPQPGDGPFNEPEGWRALFAGDAVMRALTAAALPPNENTGPFLLEAIRDPYPIVRYFAANALAAKYPSLPKPDYLAPMKSREVAIQIWSAQWSPEALRQAGETRERLSAGRTETDVEVGE